MHHPHSSSPCHSDLSSLNFCCTESHSLTPSWYGIWDCWVRYQPREEEGLRGRTVFKGWPVQNYKSSWTGFKVQGWQSIAIAQHQNVSVYVRYGFLPGASDLNQEPCIPGPSLGYSQPLSLKYKTASSIPCLNWNLAFRVPHPLWPSQRVPLYLSYLMFFKIRSCGWCLHSCFQNHTTSLEK